MVLDYIGYCTMDRELLRLRQKYPKKIPVLCQRDLRCNDIPELFKKKFLVPKDMQVSEFLFYIRRRMSLPAFKSVFMFVNNTLPSLNHTMGLLYEEYGSQDGYLYMFYATEQTFG